MRNYELRIANYGCQRRTLSVHAIRNLFFAFVLVLFSGSLRSQPIHIATIRPDEAAPGMNVVLEILSVNENLRPFGLDGLDSRSQIVLVHPQDTNRIVFGPVEVSWDGRVLQVPTFILPNASLGAVPFYIQSIVTGRFSDTLSLNIVAPQHLGTLIGNIVIGEGIGILSSSNTLVVDSLIVNNAIIHFSTAKTDTLPGNPRLLPVAILSKGPVRLTNSTISVDADSLNGGPGGGGGGHGFPGAGGMGFTGGGSSSDTTLTNIGSAANATLVAGGACATGIVGGGSEQSDQGGGGGTGAPYGVSGAAGVGAMNSPLGGSGGGSGSGEASPTFVEYGGGGGGFGTRGFGGGQPGGIGLNGGDSCGGRFLIPFAGGSGGGSGNSVENGGSTQGGSGGGGGGALEIASFDSIYLNSSTLSASGDSGTSGVGIAAGGGGGSGGAIYLSSPMGIRASSLLISVSGGEGGHGATDGFQGGNGGLGHVRIDADNNLSVGVDSNIWINGIAFTPNKEIPIHDSILLTGVAQGVLNTLDSIRIYYRSEHSGWVFVDTLRASNGTWSKWIPMQHDSLIYAVAMVEVNNPSTQQYNYEPPWIMSNASVMVLHALASPFLVAIDTLNFDSVRIGGCKSLRLRIANNGEAPLVLDSIFSGSKAFSISPDTKLTIPAYSADTLTVTFCPDTEGVTIGTLSFRSNDSESSHKQIALVGFGIALHDSLLIVPDSLIFDRVSIGDCATDTVLLKSVGHDPVRLDSSHWNDSPFTLRLNPPDTILDSGATRKLLVTFCPSDTGNVRFASVLDARGDSIRITGRGVLRLASSTPKINVGTVCFGQPDSVRDIISNLGNDTISIFSLHGTTIAFDSIGVLLQPRASDTVPVPIPTTRLGSFTDTVEILLAGDTLHTVIDYRVAGPSISIAADLSFHFVCIGECRDSSVVIINSGSDTVSISYDSLPSGSPFTLLTSPTSLAPGRDDSIRFRFCPSFLDTGVQIDTLRFTAAVEGCDSMFTLPLRGTGYDSLAIEPTDFGLIAVGSYLDSSIFVGNPCGPTAVIESGNNSNPDFTIRSILPDTIPPDGNLLLTVRFSPSIIGNETDTITLRLSNGKTLDTILSGVGYKRALPTAYFTISSTTVPMGDTTSTTIRFDSTSFPGRNTITGVLTFDPTVLAPIASFPIPYVQRGKDSVTFSEILDFNTAPSFLNQIRWLTLAGPNSSSALHFSLVSGTPLNAIANVGSITLTDCNGLAGHLASGGSYALGTITPDPVSEAASVTLTLGSDGVVEATIYDMTGRVVENLLRQQMSQGTYQITIPTTTLTAGRYMFEINSMGWRATTPFVVNR